jgi:hypothetical protein
VHAVSGLDADTPAPVEQRRWWVSWWHPADHGFDLEERPWWMTGFRERTAGPVEDSVCAAIIAPTEDAAREVVLAAYESFGPRPQALEWRFVEKAPADWSPFGERFPRGDWMVWPDQEDGQ